MKICRFLLNNKIYYGELQDDTINILAGDIESSFAKTSAECSVDEVQFLAPCRPSKIVAIGLNYKDHAEEFNLPLPQEPILFLKPSTAVAAPGQQVVYPTRSSKVDFEAELGIVISKVAKNVKEAYAQEYILGFTCANDITARDLQPLDGQWALAKSFDTFCPLGPVIASGINANNLNISLKLNNQIKQQSNTEQMIFSVEYLVSYISSVMTLLPGDVIITGTPSGVGPMQPGDLVTVEIEGIGSLTNQISGSKIAV